MARLLPWFALALAAACAASKQVASTTTTGGAGGSTTSGTSAGGATSTTATMNTSSSANGGNGGASQVSSIEAASGTGGGCVGTSVKAEPIPLDIVVMLDQSGSMKDSAGNNMSKWDTVKSALTTFMKQPNVAGIGIGLQYFGLPDPSVHGCPLQSCVTDQDCTNGCATCTPQGVCQAPSWDGDIDSCDGTDYAWGEVPIQPLPGVASAIQQSLSMHAPGTNTPTKPALEGAILYASNWEKKHPDHLTVVAFATDGGPSECDVDLNNINAVAAQGLAAKPSIKTFVIGVGGATKALDGIATAGGTGLAFHVDINALATQAFIDAMNKIRGASIGCAYKIPDPPAMMMLDFKQVNVSYKPGNNGKEQVFPKVDDKSKCPANGDAWYYDDNVKPTQIIVCDATCSKLAMDAKPQVDIVLGCTSVVL
jgi:hypothetical protein